MEGTKAISELQHMENMKYIFFDEYSSKACDPKLNN